MQFSADEVRRAYQRMRTIRTFEERVEKEFALGNIPGFVHVYIGSEASGVGICHDLTDEDYIGSTHRGHGHCIAKGCDVRGMMLEIFGREGGLCNGKGGSMHIADLSKGMLGANAIVGGSPPLAVGAALSAKLRGGGHVSVAFSGDGASNQGTMFEAMNMAVVLKAPAIFVVENNGYGEHTAASYAVGAPSIAARAEAFGLPAEAVDGADFFAVVDAMRRALDRARNGHGPAFIETRTPRWRGHFVGDPQAYRTKSELAAAMAIDALENFRVAAKERGLLGDRDFADIDAAVAQEIEDAVAAALAAPPPSLASLEQDVYVSY
ncbi:MAG: thiamine pyrophosphate-dependent dehydrogenase E1 component subunit alpha [Rhodobacter sp.]|jgi:TPP-dependent pyruvate/acetoin dehydrogenase alpha subunit|uniref:thiamine pyrophosphate-dependent dehydrogenase E1 component subunit alpha n=1 Tax=Phenylobacterium sp. TaxID=1871053 RepID=UPI0025E4CB1B|nr:thiamine pyrophosphate-dependent dehydrogenase E1 component subunit alpha [Phenylobacterium sp.]MCA3457597.1 thiamine pyrophosphate-dependent dehydrogenase E1 component subunit alpha [Rhodobacter sp.]MCA3641995.1 thiamine pyrophosphate-dependent dehydrogenase E1 component subunit alpha [Methylobacterium sp.]MCA3504465.1 thiamine pyrophosphate-dependent dehydrogenase E1 component subunit alpha [Rhodobacter sp.]MCA3740867.1 thiamine pyrophosphate-dependent dehydrogenase E1 component subunit al